MLSLSLLFTADLLGLRGNAGDVARESRKVVVEAFAVQVSMLASTRNSNDIRKTVSEFVARNQDVLGAALERENGMVLASFGEMGSFDEGSNRSTETQLKVPIYNGESLWGEVKVVFAPFNNHFRDVGWFAFMTVSSLVLFTVFLGRALVQLDPGRAVPGRVDSAMNLFSAGVFILDARLRIVMANKSAAGIANRPANELTGRTLDEWDWKTDKNWQAPWKTTLTSGLAVTDEPLLLEDEDGSERSFLISCAFVGEADTEQKGVLVTLDDMTTVERQNRELTEMLKQLQQSQELINAKNLELELLATTDPLTGIANRRTLMNRLDSLFESANENNTALSCYMTDIDHFKQVNDNYGHAVGDQVIVAVAETINALCPGESFVGRYGGEEFVVVLPGLDAESAAEVADRARIAIIALVGEGRVSVPKLSSSFGVADLTSKVADGASLVAVADEALYVAKQQGRNKVVIYDPNQVPPDEEVKKEEKVVVPQPSDLSQARVVELESLLEQRNHELDVLRQYDPLTGVPLRTLFLQRADTELGRAAREGKLVGFLSFSLREQERIVSTFGHVQSDALVLSVVERLQGGLRATDLVSVISGEHSLSRITSNEYGAMLASLLDTTSAMVVVTRIKRLLSKPFKVGDEKVYIGANIGIALSTENDISAVKLYSEASEARKAASLKPDKVAHVFASTLLHEASDDYIRLESDLHDALEAGEIETWFQPKFDLNQRRVTGMEALLRWKHETRGFVPPQFFVAVAEANGMIGQLFKCVLNATLRQILMWRSMGFDDLRISVNVSPMQLRAETLIDDTLLALKNAGVHGKHLEIELTETSVLENPEQAREALETLRKAGVGISIDDFGTGYTSLSLLADLPLDVVKIDRLFINAVESSARSRAIVGSVISMAHALDLRVVGEGVETNEQLDIMSQLGCDEVQGYLISHPLPTGEVTAFLVHQRNKEQARRA